MTTVAPVPLYLSRLVLNPRSRQVWSELAQPYEMHRTLLRAFAGSFTTIGEGARKQLGVLFRADADDRRDRVVVYLQSSVEPDWSFLTQIPGYLLDEAELEESECPNPSRAREIGSAYQHLQDGQVLSFRLRANPTKRIGEAARGDSELNGKRVGLLREEDQVAWLIRKGQERERNRPGGFEVVMDAIRGPDGEIKQAPRVRVRREGKVRGRKNELGQRHETTHLAVRFEGLLRITDADAFRETLARGIGSGKAYGFGLVSIARGEM